MLRRGGGLGLCAEAGGVREVWVEQSPDGAKARLGGSRFVEGDPEDEGASKTHAGVVLSTAPIAEVVLSADKTRELNQLVRALPRRECDYDPGCDPCVITSFEIDGETRSTSSCHGPSGCVRKFHRVEYFLSELAPRSTSRPSPSGGAAP